METGITEILELAGSKGGITVEVAINEVFDALLNRSDVTVGLRVKSSKYYNYTYYLSGFVKIDGVTLVKMNSTTPTHYAQPAALNSYTSVKRWSDGYQSSPWTAEGIDHNTDGSKTVTLEVSLRGYTSGGGGGSGWSVATTRKVALTHIPRASTLGATDANIGAVSMIAVNRKSAAYTHSVAYSFGELSGYLLSGGTLTDMEVKLSADSIPFTIPESFYEQLTDAPSGVCKLTCKTYWDTVQVGEAQTASFTVTAKESECSPVVRGSVVDCKEATVALTGDPGTLIRYMSDALCTIEAFPRKSATLVQKTIGGVPTEETTRVLNAMESGSVVFCAMDSRGYTTMVMVPVPLIPYIRLTANLTARRTDPTSGNAVLEVKGNYFSGSFGAADNSLLLTCSVDGGEAVPLIPEITEEGYRLTAQLSGLDYQSSHSITVKAADKLDTVTKTVTVGKGIPVFDWGEGDFNFHVPVLLDGVNILQKIYPVGAVYQSVQDTDPSVLFGGIWEAIEKDGLLYRWQRRA